MQIQASILALVIASAAACASSSESRQSEIVPSGKGRPELVGCAAYTPPQTPWTYDNRVWVEVMVLRDGSVEPSSPRALPSRFVKGGQGAIQRAVDMARSCYFRPIPAGARTTIQIAFS